MKQTNISMNAKASEYMAPQVELIDIRVEAGFAATTGDSTGEDNNYEEII